MSDVLERLLGERDQSGGSARKWKIGESQRGGRGVLANCDIDSGELIFVDFPVLYGPKSNNDFTGCTACSENNKPLRGCSKNCRLPVCSKKCENHESHRKECDLLRSFNVDEEDWSPIFYRCLTLIRSLFIAEDDRKIVRLLHANRGKQVDNQVADLQNLLGNSLTETETEWVRHCCGVLDGTAFEIELGTTANSLKGLYPLSAMMNHSCIPNTRLSYTDGPSGYGMLVIATKFIPQGSEILTSYCPLLWATNLRRTFLLHTKHFRCECERCQDPTEFGTYLQALRCKCGQNLLPIEPLNFNSNFKCDSCGRIKNAKFSTLLQQNLKVQSHLRVSFPDCNYVQVQGKIQSIFKTSQNGVKAMNVEELEDLIGKCVYVLRLIEQLKLGNTQFKGRLCNRLGTVAQELFERRIVCNQVDIQKFCDCGHQIETENKKARNTLKSLRTRKATRSSREEYECDATQSTKQRSFGVNGQSSL